MGCIMHVGGVHVVEMCVNLRRNLLSDGNELV